VQPTGSANGSTTRESYHYKYSKELKLPDNIYRTLSDDSFNKMMNSELRYLGNPEVSEPTLYFTPDNYTNIPTRAQIELATPTQNTWNIELPSSALDPNQVEFVRQVTGNVNFSAGGGWEIVYHGNIRFDPNTMTVHKMLEITLTR
jgi:hypothetical protein